MSKISLHYYTYLDRNNKDEYRVRIFYMHFDSLQIKWPLHYFNVTFNVDIILIKTLQKYTNFKDVTKMYGMGLSFKRRMRYFFEHV